MSSYIEFFDFKDHPFRITPDVAFFYSSPTHIEALESLKYFADSDEGFLTLIGEPGTGKTITLRKFLSEAPENLEYAYVLFPSLEPEDMFRAVLEDFGYKIDSALSKNALFSGFRDFLTHKKQQGKKILLIVDEAQNLPERTLEELRILSNLETEKEKLIQFVLAGQPELKKKLDSEGLRQLKQRVSISIELDYMPEYEMSKYVSYRLASAGYKGQFPDKKFYRQLHKLTSGNPRLVNLVMERTLMAAYVDQNKILSQNHMQNAAASLKLAAPQSDKGMWTYVAVTTLALAIMISGIYIYKKPKHRELKQLPELAATVAPKQKTAPAAKPAETKPAQVMKAYITAEKLNIRSGPGTKFTITGNLHKNTEVTITAYDGNWFRISFKDGDKNASGWVYRNFLSSKIN